MGNWKSKNYEDYEPQPKRTGWSAGLSEQQIQDCNKAFEKYCTLQMGREELGPCPAVWRSRCDKCGGIAIGLPRTVANTQEGLCRGCVFTLNAHVRLEEKLEQDFQRQGVSPADLGKMLDKVGKMEVTSVSEAIKRKPIRRKAKP